MNWLSAKKVKLHGMQDTRWTTRDKITQYKGLINLYARDRKIIEFDTHVARKKQSKELKKLHKEIDKSREKLDNAIKGDRQQLRNALAENRNMQLAYQNLPPLKVLDYINQRNFNKRKKLDRLNYEKKTTSQKLIDLKLEMAELEDRLTYCSYDQLPIEKDAQIVTGKVQDAILKKEAALAVRQTYMNIREIMKKDALYFDVLLNSLKSDGSIQGSCMIRATELGQLATEYLDDRQEEYQQLERAVKIDMKQRERDLQQARDQLDKINKHLCHLIRKDSDINLAKVFIPRTESEIELRKCIDGMEDILTYLKDSVLVSSFDCIYPCLQEQLRQKNRLIELTQKNQCDRDNILNKLNHAETMKTMLYNKMCETTFEYKSEKVELKNLIDEEIKRINTAKDLILHRNEILLHIRIGLKQLVQMGNVVTTPADLKNIKPKKGKAIQLSADETEVISPEQEETNGLKMIQNLKPKLSKLISAATPVKMVGLTWELAAKHFQTLVLNRSRVIPLVVDEPDEELVDEVLVDIMQVPNREEIKRQSAAIVEANINEDDIIMAK